MTAMTEHADAQAERSSSRFVRLYGKGPFHLVVLLACFALTLYTVLRIIDNPSLTRIAIWFVGAAVVWDLVLGPAFAVVDRLLRPLHRVRARGVSPLNFLRVPGLLSALLFMVWAPVILQRSEGIFLSKAGLTQDPYLDRWVVITLVLFAVSGLLYAVSVARASRRS